MTTSRLAPALLEQWMRDYYFAAVIDIGSSGVEDYALGELRQLLDIPHEELDRVVFRDSRTLGGQELRAAIARRWAAGDVERVIVTHGATEANFLVMNALLEPGDEVVVLDPLYQQLYAIAEAIGCRVKRLPLRFENGFVPDLDEARELIGRDTRMIVVNFPHNPTGATVSPEQQDELVELAARAGAYLVWDRTFAELTYDRPPLPDPGLLYPRAVSMGTLSKAYGLPGLRLGWCLAAPEVLRRFIRIRDYLTLHLSPLVELIAQRAIEKGDLLLGPRRQQARRNLETLERWVCEQWEWMEWVRPAGGVCAFPRLHGVADATELCRRLAEDDRVLLVPGACFGCPRHVRVGFGGASADLQAGLGYLARAAAGERLGQTPAGSGYNLPSGPG